jgi:hypothetical protein
MRTIGKQKALSTLFLAKLQLKLSILFISASNESKHRYKTSMSLSQDATSLANLLSALTQPNTEVRNFVITFYHHLKISETFII